MLFRNRVAPLMLAMAGLLTGKTSALSAQVGPIAGRAEIGATLGLDFLTAGGQKTGGHCGGIGTSSRNTEYGIRAGYKLKRWLVVEGALDFIRDTRAPNALCSNPRPPRQSGPDTLFDSLVSWEARGFPVSTATTARVALVPWSSAGGELRVYAGAGRIWQAHLTPIIAGIDGRLNVGRFILIGEAESAHSSVQLTHIASLYQDDAFLRTEETHDHKSRLSATLRFGVGFSL
jgi:hypothetical protein